MMATLGGVEYQWLVSRWVCETEGESCAQGETRVNTGIRESRDTRGIRDYHGWPYTTEEDATV